MIDLQIKLNVILVAICTSYLTMGLANPELASSLWWVYALISGSMASANLYLWRRKR